MAVNLDTYYTESRKVLERSAKRIKNPGVFDFNYLPKQVFVREEAKTIMDNIVKFDSLRVPFNLFIYEARGSGKTVLLKYLINYLKEKIKTPMMYINCRLNNTSHRILSELVGKRNSSGLGAPELYAELSKTYRRLIVVLDEIDLLSAREKRNDILYYLSRSERSYMVILLSNNPNFFNKIEPSAKSTLQLERMHFRNYNAEEIYEILKGRSQEGLNQYSHEDLKKIAALTAKESNGDVRVAIKTLQYTVVKKYERIETNFEKAREDIFLDMLFHQADQVILILKAVQVSKQGLVKVIYEKYKDLCRVYRENAYSYVHFYNNLSYL
jgi:Cdc6-like AAA superfamily ATPase